MFSETNAEGSLIELQKPPEISKQNDIFLVYNQITEPKYESALCCFSLLTCVNEV